MNQTRHVEYWNASNTISNEKAKELEQTCDHMWSGVGGTDTSKCIFCQTCCKFVEDGQ